MIEEETREQIEDIINHNEEPVKEPINEENKPKSEAKSRAKPTIKITKESIEPVEEPIVDKKPRAKPNIKITKESVEPIIEEEPIVEEEPAPVKIYKLKQIVKCPDCNMDMTVHTLKYIHKRRGFCKVDIKAEPEARGSYAPPPEPEQQSKPKITEDIVNQHIKENREIVNTYLRNERSMKAQKNRCM